MNTRGSWQYFEVLWSKTIGLCKKLNIIYNIITCNPEPQANGKIWFFSVSWFFQTLRFTRYFTQSHNDTIILIYMQTYKVNKLVFIIWHFT